MHPITKITVFGLRLGVIVLVAYWITIFLGTHLPKPPDIAPEVSDKVKHFVAYFGLTILMCYVGTGENLLRRFAVVTVIALSYGIVDELTQQLVPNRSAELLDFAADAAGVFSAIAVYAIADRYYRKRRTANSRNANPRDAESADAP